MGASNVRPMPEATVLIAVYNGERYIREAVDSILAQTYDDFELLIVNDGSTDTTRDLVLSYSDPRIHLIDNERNLGLPKSLNRGLDRAAGRYIARQDADDVSEPHRLATQIAFLKAHPDVALVGSWYTKIDAHGNVLGERRLPCNYTDIRWALLFYGPFVHSAVMLNAHWLSQTGWYNEAFAYALDYELWNRIAARFPVANIEQPLLRFRVHPESMTSTLGERTREGDALRRENVARLLGWSAECEKNRVLFERLRALVTDTPAPMDSDALKEAANELLRLQAQFCGLNLLDESECRRHRRTLSDRISRRLVREAHAYPDELHRKDAARLLRMAFRLNQYRSLNPAGLELVTKLLLGSKGVNWIRHIRPRSPVSRHPSP